MQGTYSVLQFNWDITGPGLTTPTNLSQTGYFAYPPFLQAYEYYIAVCIYDIKH